MSDRELAVWLMDVFEELYLRTRVQQALLDQLASSDVDWRAKAERSEILNAPKYRPLFDKLRSGMFGLPQEDHQETDWRETVRKLLDEGET